MSKYRKKPVVVDAVLWAGGDYEHLNTFCGLNWTRGDAVEEEYNDKEQVVVWNALESQWLHVPVGHYIIRGVSGELYPCDPDVFQRTYEPVEDK